MIYIAEKHTQL